MKRYYCRTVVEYMFPHPDDEVIEAESISEAFSKYIQKHPSSTSYQIEKMDT